jgi:hypothetical protein
LRTCQTRGVCTSERDATGTAARWRRQNRDRTRRDGAEELTFASYMSGPWKHSAFSFSAYVNFDLRERGENAARRVSLAALCSGSAFGSAYIVPALVSGSARSKHAKERRDAKSRRVSRSEGREQLETRSETRTALSLGPSIKERLHVHQA